MWKHLVTTAAQSGLAAEASSAKTLQSSKPPVALPSAQTKGEGGAGASWLRGSCRCNVKVASASYYIITLKINIRPGKKRETRGRIEMIKE